MIELNPDLLTFGGGIRFGMTSRIYAILYHIAARLWLTPSYLEARQWLSA